MRLKILYQMLSCQLVISYQNIRLPTPHRHPKISQRSLFCNGGIEKDRNSSVSSFSEIKDNDVNFDQISQRNKDPRLLEKCRSILGSKNNELSVYTIEDIIALALKEPSPRESDTCSILNPYGKFVYTSMNSSLSSGAFHDRTGILYIEIPKVATSSLKEWLPLCIHPTLGTGTINHQKRPKSKFPPHFAPNQLSFVIVREPLTRFLSGYQTVRLRALLLNEKVANPKQNGGRGGNGGGEDGTRRSEMAEIRRFQNFVTYFTSHGALLKKQNLEGSCAWCHTLSQMWFIEMYPLEITYILHLERLEKELKEFKSVVPIMLQDYSLLEFKNTKENRISDGALEPTILIKNAPDAIQAILHYLRQDYACLDYPIPRF